MIEKWLRTSEVGRAAAAEIGAAFSRVLATAGAAVDGIMAALKVGDVRGALRVAVMGAEAIWNEFIAALLGGWHHFSNLFRDTWRDVLAWLQSAWVKFESWLDGRLVAVIEAVVVPVVDTLNAVEIAAGTKQSLKTGIEARRKEIEQARAGNLADIARQVDADKGATLEGQAARRKEYRDAAERLRGEIADVTARLVQEATAIDVVGGGVGGAATLTASPELGGRKGDPIGLKSEQLGLAVQGVYQSADFAGAFGRGKGTDPAQVKQLKEIETINKWLEKIFDKLQPGVFG
jgi:hypothetical protein